MSAFEIDASDQALPNSVKGALCSLGDARERLSKCLGISVTEADILRMIELKLVVNFGDAQNEVSILADEIEAYGAKIDWEPASRANLSEGTLFELAAPARTPDEIGRITGGQLVFTIRSNLSMKIRADSFRPYEYQLFRREFGRTENSTSRPVALANIPNAGEPIFISTSESQILAATSAWRRAVESSRDATEDERRITPSIYGVKTRLIPMISSVANNLAGPDSVVCDLMSGSGIVTRSLSKEHLLFSNDANSYGRVLAISLTSELRKSEVEPLVTRLKSKMLENMAAIEKLYSQFLIEEHELLHSAQTSASLERYQLFCEATPTFSGNLVDAPTEEIDERSELRNLIGARRGRPETFPFVLATAYWANVHFGLRQCVLLDSLRYAIEQENEPLRTLLLGLLLQAALLCASGPHFAQPFKPKGARQFKALIEKRAKRLDAEFFALVARRSLVPPSPHPVIDATKLNWREALQAFTSALKGRRGVVYADPPYTAVQYSRYYHVLNVLVDYDYPVCSGPGVCPVREYRFSSRFEFKAGPARIELRELIRQCARSDLDLILSYSKSGAVTVVDLIVEFKACYEDVEIFQSNIKHHPQGKAPPPGRLNTVEYVLVGRQPRLSPLSP
jgi:adenine-specific DNA methylase